MIVGMNRSICVFCASGDGLSPQHMGVAEQLGRAIGRAGDTLVYGGGTVGLMGHLAAGALAEGGRVVGVIPQFMVDREWANRRADELVITDDMRQRKLEMERRSDAFVALAGGFGTLEELIEIVTYRNLRLHEKPIVLLNTAGFYDRLVDVFEHFIHEKFAKERHRESYFVAATVDEAMTHIDSCVKASNE
jgi:uncharacterized protein (TIGR00730 family)